MANAGVRGRPIAPLVLSAQERAYLERQVRRHRVARSLSERCRAILRCADGLPSKSVAAELGIHEHTVGKWRRRFLKDRCDGMLDEARPGRPRTIVEAPPVLWEAKSSSIWSGPAKRHYFIADAIACVMANLYFSDNAFRGLDDRHQPQ